MDYNLIPNNEYLLLTPGPLSTTKSVRAAMLKDWCTWDDDYKTLVQNLRKNLLNIADLDHKIWTTVLMQGSGTFSVEATLGSLVPKNGKLLIISNGTYGKRMCEIAKVLGIDYIEYSTEEVEAPKVHELEELLKENEQITHISCVYVETTSGMINPIKKIGALAKAYNKIYIVDAMSAFGGIEIDFLENNIDFLISSSNKCIQGVPGFGFVIGKIELLKDCKNNARSLSLDLYDQWINMEKDPGKWRFTSPTHTVRAFYQALMELVAEGGIKERAKRYKNNQRMLVNGMKSLGFVTLLNEEYMSPIITSFHSPNSKEYDFNKFYNLLKEKSFVIYPGKVTNYDTFRIGTIGDVYERDIISLIDSIKSSIYWNKV